MTFQQSLIWTLANIAEGTHIDDRDSVMSVDFDGDGIIMVTPDRIECYGNVPTLQVYLGIAITVAASRLLSTPFPIFHSRTHEDSFVVPNSLPIGTGRVADTDLAEDELTFPLEFLHDGAIADGKQPMMKSRHSIQDARWAIAGFYGRQHATWADCFARRCPRTALALHCLRAFEARYPGLVRYFDLGIWEMLEEPIQSGCLVHFPDLDELWDIPPGNIHIEIEFPGGTPDYSGCVMRSCPDSVYLRRFHDDKIELAYEDPALVDQIEDFMNSVGYPIDLGD